MKKGLMMAIAASTVLFAGGDIAPVQPVAEAPAAACNDFYGHVGAGVIYASGSEQTVTGTGDGVVTFKDGSQVTIQKGKKYKVPAVSAYTYGVAAVLGVTKEIFSGLTLNVEVQGATTKSHAKIGKNEITGAVQESGALTQLNLGYTFCNTAIKVGRFAVPAALSPLVATNTGYLGLKRNTFEGVLVANTDLPDTTVWASYLRTIVLHANAVDGFFGASQRAHISVVAGGFQNKSFADTTITLAGYYDTTAATELGKAPVDRALPWKFMVAGSVDTKFCDTDISVGAAYRAYDNNGTANIGGSDYMVGGYVTQHFGSVDATFAATYVADADDANDSFAHSAGYFKKYTDKTGHGDFNREGWAIGAALSTDWCGYKFGAFAHYTQQKDYTVGANVATTFKGINFAVDYRYKHNTIAGLIDGYNSQRIRAKAVYKF